MHTRHKFYVVLTVLLTASVFAWIASIKSGAHDPKSISIRIGTATHRVQIDETGNAFVVTYIHGDSRVYGFAIEL